MDTGNFAETMGGESVAWMAAVAAEKRVTLCGSLIIEEHGNFYNRLIWMPPDGRGEHYDKRHLFRMVGEHRHYSAGTRRRVFRLNGWRICPLICYDLRFPVWSRGIDEFDLLIYIANWPAARRSAWRILLPARAVENQCYAIGVNRIGTDGNGIPYAGDSAAFDYLGKNLMDCGVEACAARVTLEGGKLLRYREKFPAYRDADSFRLAP
jgi:predicted amidohydrolase